MEAWRIFSPVVAVAAYLVVYAFFGARLTVNHGLGWDGNLYADLAMSFPDAIRAGIAPYMSWRVLPSAIIHGVSRVLDIDLSDAAMVLAVFRLYNSVLFVGSAWLWGLASADRDRAIAVLGFIGLFLNFHAMIGVQFSSVQTDTTALFLGMAMLYGWVSGRQAIVFAAALAGAFSWPTALAAGLLLLVFPHSAGSRPLRLPCRWCLAAGAALSFAMLLGYAIVSGARLCCGAPQVDYPLLALSTVIAVTYVFYIAYAAKEAMAMPRLDAAFLRGLGAAALLLLAVGALRGLEHVRGDDHTTRDYLLGSALTAVAKPGTFLVAHVTYLGPLFLFCLVRAPSLFRTAREAGLGAVGILVMFFAMSVNSESRQLYFFWPFVIYLLGETLSTSGTELRGWRTIALVGSSLLLSKFYLPFGIAMPDDPTGSLFTRFPWQWFFMNEGPWMSWAGYGINLALCAAASAMLAIAWRTAPHA